MKVKNILLFLCLVIAGTYLYGQKRIFPQLPLMGAIKDNNLKESQPMDTISGIEFATRVDSLYKYLPKEPNSTWEVVFKNGIRKPDLQIGDLLRVTKEDGSLRYYFLKLKAYSPNTNALLGSITWPDMPVSFRGEMANSYGWKGDTIPSFDSHTMDYVLILPKAYQKIPALTFYTVDPNATVMVKRAISLEGTIAERTITFTVFAEDSITKNVYSVLLKKEQDTLDIQDKSTISSRFYKVSEGTSLKETIKGVIIGTTVADFYSKIARADEGQSLKIISSASGTELIESDLISKGDTLIVISANKMNTAKYLLEVTTEGLSKNDLLTSSIYTVSVNGSTGTIIGLPKYTLLKTVLAEVAIPSGATLTVVDQNDAYKPLVLLNYDTAYVHVQATSAVYFEVVAENGVNKVLYQLLPDYRSRDAYVTSDVYTVDQYQSLIFPFRQGTSVASLLRDITPVRGATMKVMDKEGFVRNMGLIYKDDKLVVTSEDCANRKVYYFSGPAYVGGPYLAFIISDYYNIDQITHIIYAVPEENTNVSEFKSKLIPAVGATIKVLDIQGNEVTRPTLQVGDFVRVTSSDLSQTIIYRIANKTQADLPEIDSSINVTPNPTMGKVIVRGLSPGNRLRIINTAGIVVHDLIANSSTQILSLDSQPGGIYIIAIYAGNHPPAIQKVVKK